MATYRSEKWGKNTGGLNFRSFQPLFWLHFLILWWLLYLRDLKWPYQSYLTYLTCGERSKLHAASHRTSDKPLLYFCISIMKCGLVQSSSPPTLLQLQTFILIPNTFQVNEPKGLVNGSCLETYFTSPKCACNSGGVYRVPRKPVSIFLELFLRRKWGSSKILKYPTLKCLIRKIVWLNPSWSNYYMRTARRSTFNREEKKTWMENNTGYWTGKKWQKMWQKMLKAEHKKFQVQPNEGQYRIYSTAYWKQ